MRRAFESRRSSVADEVRDETRGNFFSQTDCRSWSFNPGGEPPSSHLLFLGPKERLPPLIIPKLSFHSFPLLPAVRTRGTHYHPQRLSIVFAPDTRNICFSSCHLGTDRRISRDRLQDMGRWEREESVRGSHSRTQESRVSHYKTSQKESDKRIVRRVLCALVCRSGRYTMFRLILRRERMRSGWTSGERGLTRTCVCGDDGVSCPNVWPTKRSGGKVKKQFCWNESLKRWGSGDEDGEDRLTSGRKDER